MQTIFKISLKPEQIMCLTAESRNVLRKVHFVRELKNLALVRYLHFYYVIEHDLRNKQYFLLIKTKKITEAVQTYLEYLCIYA